jgi:hypothetical protein
VFGVGLALASPLILPMSELAALSHRGSPTATSEGYAAYSSLAMPFWNLITVLIPDFFGNPSKGTFWGPYEYAEFCMYIGILPLLVLPLAFSAKETQRKQMWFFAGLGLLALLMTLGTAVNRLFYFGLPGFAGSGSPARVLFLFVMSAAVLAGIGLDKLLKEVGKERSRAVSAVLFAGLGIVVFGATLFFTNAYRLSDRIGTGDLIAQIMPDARPFFAFFLIAVIILALTLTGRIGRKLGIALILCIMAADMLAFGIQYNPTCSKAEVYPSTRLTDFLQKNAGLSRVMPINEKWAIRNFPQAVLPPDTASVYGLYDVSGYDSLFPVRYKALLDAAAGGESCPPENGNILFARNPGSPIYNLLGVRWFISQQPLGSASRKIDGCYVQQNPKALPRAFIVYSAEAANDSDTLRRMATGQTDLGATALIAPVRSGIQETEIGQLLTAAPALSTRRSVEITKYTCNTVGLSVGTDRTGLLILTDQYYPGWRASIDGKPAPIIRADYDFRAIIVPAGHHQVIFHYAPHSLTAGYAIALVAVVFLLCICAAKLVRNQRCILPS